MSAPPVIFEEKPRWPEAPPICELANLPSFKDQKAAKKFHTETCGLTTQLLSIWLCSWCKGWHYWADCPAPAGATSGTARHASLPKHIATLAREARGWFLQHDESEQVALLAGQRWEGDSISRQVTEPKSADSPASYKSNPAPDSEPRLRATRAATASDRSSDTGGSLLAAGRSETST